MKALFLRALSNPMCVDPTRGVGSLSAERISAEPDRYLSNMTDNTENQAPESAPKRNNRLPVIIAFMAIVIIIQGIKIYLDTKEKQEVRTQLITTEEELATTMQRLTEISGELDERIAQVEKLGGDVS